MQGAMALCLPDERASSPDWARAGVADYGLEADSFTAVPELVTSI